MTDSLRRVGHPGMLSVVATLAVILTIFGILVMAGGAAAVGQIIAMVGLAISAVLLALYAGVARLSSADGNGRDGDD